MSVEFRQYKKLQDLRLGLEALPVWAAKILFGSTLAYMV